MSVGLSALLFRHKLSSVAVLAMAMVFCMVFSRAIRPWTQHQDRSALLSAERSALLSAESSPQSEHSGRPVHWSVLCLRWAVNGRPGFKKFAVCAVGILALYSTYEVASEYLSVHSFRRLFFKNALFIIAVNHTCSALFAFGTLYLQGLPAFPPGLSYTLVPAGANVLATTFQHVAFYHVGFPAQSVMKSVGIVPVLCIGSLLGNRVSTKQDWAEALFITFMVLSFTWNLNLLSLPEHSTAETVWLLVTITGYVVSASLTSNLEDVIYQYHNLNPGQMLLGLELASGAAAWIAVLLNGDLFEALAFIGKEPQILVSIGLLALAASAGAYTCTLTVRLFGPAVLTLLQTCRQILSLAISLAMFQHGVDWKSCICLVPVSLMALHSCIRQVGQQMPGQSRSGGEWKALRPMMSFLAPAR